MPANGLFPAGDEFEGLRWHSTMTPWLKLELVLIFGDTGLPVNT